LSTFPIHLPALRERREDLTILSAALLKRMSPTRELSLSAAAQRLLQEQEFPGNVRELRNLLERTALLCDGDTLGIRQLERALLVSVRPQASTGKVGTLLQNCHSAAEEQRLGSSKLKEAERVAFAKLVEGYAGDRAELAQHLGISARTLYRKLKALK
jgi:DNA-binding NtrC family response regulator